jgi:pyruvate/2-oxoglutarate dehydrogenase complex dihydrolipoamide acyltransferase (E2) component
LTKCVAVRKVLTEVFFLHFLRLFLLQVKPDQNVEVGHVVASVNDDLAAATTQQQQQQQQPGQQPQQAQAAPAAPESQAPAAQAPPSERAPKPPKSKGSKAAAAPPAASQPGAAAAPAGSAHRHPSIHFPPRRTPDGQLISALPAAEAERLLGQLLGGDGGGPAHEPAAQGQYKNMIAVPIVGGSMPVLRGPPVPAGPPGPPRRTMTDREMELIMLGGADP